MASVQVGSALAKTLFDDIGPGGAVMLRVALAAIVLMLVSRPQIRGRSRSELLLAGVFGLTLAAMNTSFYESVDRIPLGAAVTCEFVGPLGVAVWGSRRPLDVVWVVLAAAGILLLVAPSGADLNATGVILALAAGGCWAAYILLSARTGQAFPGLSGLAVAMAVAAVLTLPLGIAEGGADLFQPEVIGIGIAVACLSSLIPYSVELEALRRLPAHVFGVLMSLEPACAAIAGLIILGQVLEANEWVGMALVIVASAGATRYADRRMPAPRDA
ncbi:MAG: inner rane transporter RhtA [Thermoleophilaceae bacterium]|nr:inner rane transporter RhtA [Thermoleophilaceae bacterium]